MGKIICIASLKGGVGKTTTAVNLSAAFAHYGKRVLLVDCDHQGSATLGVGIDKKKISGTLYDVMSSKIGIDQAIVKTQIHGLDVIPMKGEFFRAEVELKDREEKEKVLRSALYPCKDRYDFILLDTPPSVGLISINAMTASDAILIPLQCEFLAYESFIQMLQFARLIKRKLNPDLKLSGVLLTMYEMGEKISQRITDNVKGHLKRQVFNTIIPRSVEIREVAGSGKPMVALDLDSVGSKSYLRLAHEIMSRSS